jgi:hypothetical protein
MFRSNSNDWPAEYYFPVQTEEDNTSDLWLGSGGEGWDSNSPEANHYHIKLITAS